jgi:hypothetical protein
MTSTAGSGPSGPVFVDHSGRRHRTVRRVGVFLALLGVAYGALLMVLTATGAHIDAPGLPFLEHLPQVLTGRSANPPASGPTSAATPTPGVTGSPMAAAQQSSAATPSASAPTTHGKSQQTASATPSATPTLMQTPTPPGKPTSRPSATARGKSTSAPGAVHRHPHP